MVKANSDSTTCIPYSYELGKFPLCAFTVQMIFTILFAYFVDYGAEANATHYTHEYDPIHGGKRPHENSVYMKYPAFKDVHVMAFVGFGFLFTFLKKYSYSSIGINTFLAAILMQWSILCEGFYKLDNGIIMLSIDQILSADMAAVTGLISWGAVLGKINPLQTLFMAIIEMPVYACCKWLITTKLKAIDPGASITCHVFGAYFGLAVSCAIFKKEHKKHPNEKRRDYLDIFAMIGTIFLWIYWPTFNAAMESGDDRHRAILNTYLSMLSSCVMTFAMSSLLDPQSRFNMVHVQNATLAGGIAIGSACSTMLGPYVALIIGSMAGIICTICLKLLTPFLSNRCRIHDTCGIHSLHGIVGIFGGIVGVVMAALAANNLYGLGLYLIYPAMAPNENSPEFTEIRSQLSLIKPGDGRTASQQAIFQLVALITTLVISIVGGLITGVMMRFSLFGAPTKQSLFNDEDYWDIPNADDEDDNIFENEGLSNDFNRHTPSIKLRPTNTVLRMVENSQQLATPFEN